MHLVWESTLKREINWYAVYFTIHNVLIDNRIKQLKFKLIHKIIPTNENLFIWKQIDTPFCKHCNEVETLEHFFIKCSYVDTFWEIIHILFNQQGICKRFSMYEIVIGYKIQYKEFQEINLILSQITYSIYKSYMISERRSKTINILKIWYYDLLTLETYFDNKKSPRQTIIRFNNALREFV